MQTAPFLFLANVPEAVATPDVLFARITRAPAQHVTARLTGDRAPGVIALPDSLSYSVQDGDDLRSFSGRPVASRMSVASCMMPNGHIREEDVLVSIMPNGDILLTDGVAHFGAVPVEVSLRPAQASRFNADNTRHVRTAGARAFCFCNDTLIETARGPIPVQDIRTGFPVRTLDHGTQPVRWVGTTVHKTPRNQAPIHIAAGALGHGFPYRPLLVSPQHRLMLRSPIAERMFGQMDVLVPAKALLDVRGIQQFDGDRPVRYWHIAFAKHAIVVANGTWAESLYPGTQRDGMDASDVVALEMVFEQNLAQGQEKQAAALPPARPILRGEALRAFVAQHLKKRRAFISTIGLNEPQDQTG